MKLGFCRKSEGIVADIEVQGGNDLNGIIMDAMTKFVVSNPLHPEVFPGKHRTQCYLAYVLG